MIDIHTHVLPGVDDGPQNWEESISLLRQGYADGIRGVLCTSHVMDLLDEQTGRLYALQFSELKRRIAAEGIGLELWLGSELHCQAEFSMDAPLATFNGDRRYCLVELPMGSIPADAEDKLFTISMAGITPVLAHPERNRTLLHRHEKAWELRRRNILFQVNAGSICGHFGKEVRTFAFFLLEYDLVTFVATDCHHARSRPMLLSPARAIIARNWGENRAEALCHGNPYKAVTGEAIRITDPGAFPKKKGVLNRLFPGLQRRFQ